MEGVGLNGSPSATVDPEGQSGFQPRQTGTFKDSPSASAARPNISKKLFRIKNLSRLQDTEENNDGSELKKVLGTRDLVSLGVGSCVGTGMYLVSGMVAKNIAGPAVVLSYAIAGIAALFSGFCYSELAVRVPHTTGSAYIYSYVTVGEFVAFIIGWNMILEYIIGSSACACALSACLDILSSGAISNITAAWSGDENKILNTSPDIIAFLITLLMMVIFFFGVKGSVIFNHVLNVFNVISLAIIVICGLYKVKGENWTDDFMPFGFSGVVKGAARCFYAFIGFDIIATTGEEAKNPKEAIPKAIISSLVIITVAYVICSSIMTLMVPYSKLDIDAGLVQVWGQVGLNSVEWIISVCALGALTVSMFGSMFPMPRIAYAMAKDRLLFSVMARVNRRGVPACANLWLGLIAAVCALFFPLEVLIEMMSIGTLLAYTLVNCCVLILRFQPERKNLIEQFQREKSNEEIKLNSKELCASGKNPALEEDDKPDPKPLLPLLMDLLNGRHPSQKTTDCTRSGGRIVLRLFFSLVAFIFIFDLALVLSEGNSTSAASVVLFLLLTLIIICHIVAMAHFPQSKPVGFNTPCVPVVPVLGILINIYLMFRLSSITLIRFTIWMLIGLVIYFKYGIWESSYDDWNQ